MESAGDLSRRLAQAAEAICRQFLPNGRRQGCYWLVGDVQGHRGRSLYVRLTGHNAGSWTDAATGEHGDLLDLIALNRNLSIREAMAEARAVLRLPLPISAPPTSWMAPTGSPGACRRLFAASKPLPSTLAERYLAKRGIVLPHPEPALRFHPRCHRWELSGTISMPALIAAVTDDGGHLTGLHRTWLSPDGDKATLDDPRRAMGQLLGNGVRFGPAGPVMAAGEGLETMLSLRRALPLLPAVAALSAAHLAAWTFPALLRRLYVVCDADAAGEWALARLSSRGHSNALTVLPLLPRLGDLNSDLMAYGLSALREWIVPQLAEGDAATFMPSKIGPWHPWRGERTGPVRRTASSCHPTTVGRGEAAFQVGDLPGSPGPATARGRPPLALRPARGAGPGLTLAGAPQEGRDRRGPQIR